MAPHPPMPPVPPVTVPPMTTMAPVPADQQQLHQQTGNEACIKRLKQLNVEAGSKVYLKPSAPGNAGKKTAVQTNIFGIEVLKETTVYRYVIHIKADLSPTKEVIFTKKGKEDYIVLDRFEKCCNVFQCAVEQNSDFFKDKDGNKVIYDGQSTLYTTMNLFSELDDDSKKTKGIEVKGADTKNQDLSTLECIMMIVSAPRDNRLVISQENIGRRTADQNIDVNNREYAQFMELVLNQKCIEATDRYGLFEHGKIYFLQPSLDGFTIRDCVDVGDGKELHPGLKKAVQFIEGPFGRDQNNPSLVIDGMKAAFHKQHTVIQKISEILINRDPSNLIADFDREKATNVIKGLDCFTSYNKRTRHIRIEGIHHESPAKAKFELPDGNSCTVLQYFQDKYNIQLKYPNSNLIICKERGNKNFYPSELLTISKNQRVTIPQQTGQQSQKTTKECAVLPDVRQRLIVKGKEAIGITENNQLLDSLGIKVYDAPLMVEARELGTQELKYDKLVRAEAGKWRPSAGFNKPISFPSLWAMYAVGNAQSRFNDNDLNAFGNMFLDTCKRKGINVGPPAESCLISADSALQKLENAASQNCKFVFVITDDSITHLHQKYKALEQRTMMIVQDMKMSRVMPIIREGKKLTLENVISKTNMKLGGLNYKVDTSLLKDDQLIIGVGVSAPPPGTKYILEGRGHLNPQIIGYSSNARSSQEFVGDFLLAPVGQDTMPSIEDILKNTIESYQKNRNCLPKKVIIYRSGVSEGSHASLLAYEIPLAKAIIAEFSKDVKLIYIIVAKEHSYRFFKEQLTGQKATEMNIPPGIILDQAVTHPACKQFFLNSHTTLQGTAKTPLYTVLSDDCDAPMDTLESLTYSLCYLHQIVSLTTSVPTPLYVANEYAKRGRALWAEKTVAAPIEAQGVEADLLKELTKDISYQNTDLHDKRVNA